MACDISLIFLILIHCFVWIFVIFGGFFSPTICQINMLVIIPAIYLIHIMSFHVIVKTKMQHILKNCENFDNLEAYIVKPKKVEDLRKYLPQDLDEEKAMKVIKIYLSEEDKLVIPKIHRKMEDCFETSFANPFSPQGMLILGMIVSIYLLKFYWKKFST